VSVTGIIGVAGGTNLDCATPSMEVHTNKNTSTKAEILFMMIFDFNCKLTFDCLDKQYKHV
jgi:hypothetical protein